MLTEQFYIHLASALKNEPQGVGETLFIAIGGGEQGWDLTPPPLQRNTSQLVNEIARKSLAGADIRYLTVEGQVTESLTPRLRISATFSAGEGVGTLRECGLFGGATAEAGSGTLLTYYIHPRIEKTAENVLERRIELDLTPTASGPGQIVTRYLGNSSSEEFHDLENLKPQCQVDEIRIDRRVYFANSEQALELGYDYCAFCFGRELSQR